MLSATALAGTGLLLSSGPVQAQTQWTGATSTNWFTAGNWNPAAVPGAATDVQINTITPNPTVIGQAGAQAVGISIGSATGNVGNLTVTGSGSTLAVGNGLFLIGDFGQGSFTVSNGGVASTTGQTYVAADPNSSGMVLITGTGSQFSANGGLFVGADNNAVGQVTVQSGGRLVGSVTLGAIVAGGSGTLNITGTGTTFSGSAVVGSTSTGILNITSGASYSAASTTVGNSAGSNGTLTVDGTGTTFSSTAVMTVGASGTGTFNLQNGATATTNVIVSVAASSATGNGTANISGAGTTWSTGNVRVGTFGTGAINITDGAVVNSGISFASGIVFVGGNATVSGTGSTWNISGNYTSSILFTLATGSTSVAGSNFQVLNGGRVIIADTATGTNGSFADVRIGSGTNQRAAVTIDGTGSTLTTPYIAYVGYGAGSNATVTVSGGGTMNTGFTVIAAGTTSTGAVTITGAGSVWNLSDTSHVAGGLSQGLTVGQTGAGTLTLAQGGTLNVLSTGSTVILGGIAGSSGTLNIGAASASPAVAPGTLNASTVIFATGPTSTVNFNHTSSNYVFAPQLTGSGAGSVNIIAGTTIFTADNTYSVATTNVSAGATAQFGNGGTTGSTTGNITNNGAVAFNRSNTVTYAGVISSGGSLEQKGTGTLILTGANIYTGGTTITSGTLQIGGTTFSSGTTGSVAGNIVNNSALVFRRSNSITYNGVVSGSGSLTQQGIGNLTLGGASTYTGGTNILAGTLTLGGNNRLAATGALNFGSSFIGIFALAGFNQTVGDLSGNGTVSLGAGTLTAGAANSTTHGGGMTGTGNFVKEGTGTLTFTGTKTFNGATTINNGTLLVNGTDANSAVTVNAAGTLGGSGTVGATNVFGTIAPGNSIGTLNVTGTFTQSTGSTYVVEVAPGGGPGTSDLINVTGAPGTATIQAGTTVSVVAAAGAYTTGTRYTILTAPGGVTGTYTTLIDNAAFLDFALAYDANNVYLDITRAVTMFSSVAQTPNQRAAATGAENLGAGNPVFNAIVPLDLANALRAFDLLSGEIHASVAGTLLEDSRFIRNAVTGRLQSIGGAAAIFAPRLAALNFAEDGEDVDTAPLMFDSAALGYAPQKRKRVRDTMDRALPVKAQPATPGRVFTAWGQAFGSWGSSDGDGNAAALSRSTGGFITGLDVTFAGGAGDVWRAGLAGGYQYTSLNVGDRSSSGRIDTYHLAAYGGRQIGPLGLRAGAAYGWHDISTSRSIVFPGFSDTTKAKYDAGTAQVFGEIGYALANRQFALEPFAGLAYVSVRTTSFAEAGGAAALNGTGGTTGTTYSSLGLRAASPLPWRDLSGLTAKASAAWRHAFGTVTPTAQLGFASGTTPFVVAGTPIARDAAALEFGLEGTVARGATLGVAYTGQVAGNADDHGITANYVQRF
ncbi:MAG: autotransporter domain-containing protein [Xanthobacteraceae bacterium]|nr:autotransporter domain-containing protein [Xanthobacteraceae bacterium]